MPQYRRAEKSNFCFVNIHYSHEISQAPPATFVPKNRFSLLIVKSHFFPHQGSPYLAAVDLPVYEHCTGYRSHRGPPLSASVHTLRGNLWQCRITPLWVCQNTSTYDYDFCVLLYLYVCTLCTLNKQTLLLLLFYRETCPQTISSSFLINEVLLGEGLDHRRGGV